MASFSLAMMRTPEIASIKLCKESETIAREFDKSPTTRLKTASRKLVAMNQMPDLMMTRLRVVSCEFLAIIIIF